MATNQAAFNATVQAIANNQASFAPYLVEGALTLNTQNITATDTQALASALQNNTVLTVLYCSYNSIGDSGATALAQALKINSTLTFLDLDSNFISPSGISALATALTNNTSLKILSLRYNSIGPSGISALGIALANNTSIKQINLQANSLGSSGATSLATLLASNTSLQYIDCVDNSISNTGATALATALTNNTSLQGLDIRGNSISDAGVSAIASALQTNSALTYLDLRGNPITDNGYLALLNALKNNFSLTSLGVDTNIYSAQINALLSRDTTITQALTDLKNNAITTLDLSNQQINDIGVQLLAEALKINTSLTSLYLYSNPMTSVGAQALAAALEINTSITFLDLHFNPIGDTGAQALASVLQIKNKTLTGLNLNNIPSLTDNCAQALANMLMMNTSLLSLYMSDSRLTDVGIQVLSTALQKNKSLTVFGAGGSALITNVSAVAIANVLKENTHLTGLALLGTNIDNTGAQILASALQNSSLVYLDLRANLAGDIGIQAFITALQNNYVLTTFLVDSTLSNLTAINLLLTRNRNYLIFNTNHLSLSQGGSLILDSTYLQVTQTNDPPITFNVTQITHGEFINATTRLPIIQFTQAQVNVNQVEVLHDGSYYPLSYAVTASNGTTTTVPHQGTVIFTRQPNPPKLLKNSFTLSRNQTTILTTDNLLASFDGVTPLPGLIFNVQTFFGQIEYVNQTQALTTFSQASVMNGQIEFACDNSGQQPICLVQVSDGNRTSVFIPANITFIPFTTLSPTTQTITSTSTVTSSLTFTTQAPPPSTFMSSSSPKMSTTFTQLPSSTSMMSSSTSTSSSLIPAQSSSAGRASLVPMIAGIAGGVVALAGLSIAWVLYRRRRLHPQVATPSDNIIPMQENPLHRGVFLTDATTTETRIDGTLPRPTAWDATLYDVQKPSSYEEPHPAPSTPWSAQHYDVSTLRRSSLPPSPYETLVEPNAPPPRPLKSWDQGLYETSKK